MNIVFYALVALSVAAAAWATLTGAGDADAMATVGQGALDGVQTAVTLAITLTGSMALFLGLLKVVEKAGGMDAIAYAIRPLMVRLFPDVPADHPAMGAMVMNLAANVLGLGNAATPFGVRAMEELETLNEHPGTATNAMVLFLAINTSGVAVLPLDVIALRTAAGSSAPAAVFVTTLVATACSTLAGVTTAKLLQRVMRPPVPPKLHPSSVPLAAFLPLAGVLGGVAGLVALVLVYGAVAASWVLPLLILGMLTVGLVRGVRVYEAFIEGARGGVTTAVRILPYLVAILVSIGMFRASGGMDLLTRAVTPLCRLIGFPPEVLPLAVLRPFSGSGALGLTGEMTKTFGPDTFLGQVAGTIHGSSETTFYVLAVYFGAVGVTRARHAIAAGLAADVVGALAAVAAVRLFL